MRRLFKVAAAILLIAALGGARQLAFAQQQSEASASTTPEVETGGDPELARAGRPPAPYTTQYESHRTINADLSATKLTTVRWKILIPSAIQTLGQQQITFIEGMETLDIVEAYTEKTDGRRVPVPPASILTHDAQEAASALQAVYLRDQKQKTIIYPDVAVGDTLVLTTRREQRQGMFPGQFADVDLFPRSQSFTAAEVTVDAPVALDLQVRTIARGFTDEVTVDGDVRHRRIALTPEPYHPEEPGAVSPLDRDSMVLISTFKSYEEIGLAYGKAALPKAAVTPQIAALANKITGNIDDRKAQAVAIDAWMKKHIRYVAVYLSVGRVVPNDATHVLMNKFGDCKDKVTLMSALLAAKGIASEATLVNASNSYTLPDPPMPGAFNHVIIYLPDFDLYDDPTLTGAAFGGLAAEEQDKPVVRVSANGVRVARTPAMRPEDHIAHVATTIKVAADGTVTGVTRQSNTGYFGLVLRTMGEVVQTLGETAASRQLQSFNTPGTGRFDLGNVDDTVDPVVVTGSFKLHDKFKVPRDGGRWAIPRGMPLTARLGSFLLGDQLGGRQSAFRCLAGRQIEDVEASFDAALPMPAMPLPLANDNVENPLFTYRSTYAVQGRTLKIHREFVSRVPGQVCSPAVEAEIAGDMKTVRTDVYSTIPFAAPGKMERVATVGQKTKIGFLTILNVDCTSKGFAAVRILEQPQHGVAAAESGIDYPSYAQANPRSACNKQQVPGTLVTYQSQSGFAGADSVTIETTWPDGELSRTRYAITVNPAPAAPAAPQPPPTIEVASVATAGQKRTIDFLTSLNADCTSVGFASVRILEQPQHGVAAAENGADYPSYSQGNPDCSKQRVPGTLITYQSQPGFAGADSVTVEVTFANGALSRKRYAITVNPAPIAAPAPAPAATDPPQTVDVTRVATVGQKRVISFWTTLNVDCSSVGFATVRISEQPKHGVAAAETGTGYPNYPQANPRSACNKQQVPGTLVTYQSQSDFTGADSVTIEVMFAGGALRRVHYAISVNPAPIAAPALIAASTPGTPQMLEFTRTAAAGQRLLVAFLYELNPDCSPVGFATVRVVGQPKHGKVKIEKGTGFTTFPQKNLRFECNKRRSNGVNLSYHPERGFTGGDSLVVDVIYPDGTLSKRRYAIDVR